jgi:hypothetical protein
VLHLARGLSLESDQLRRDALKRALVLGHGAILVVIAIGYFSMRHQRSIRQRRFRAALLALLALLWLVEVVGYLIDWW